MDGADMARRVRRYFDRLSASDFSGVLDLFEPDATVQSPFLGRMPAAAFFAKLAAASRNSDLTVFEVLFGEGGTTAAAHFEYDWTLKGGDRIVFSGFDHFTFSDTGRFSELLIVYDTHPVRADVGDKYASA